MLGIYLIITLLLISLLMYSMIKYIEDSMLEEKRAIKMSRRRHIASSVRNGDLMMYTSSSLSLSDTDTIRRFRKEGCCSLAGDPVKKTCFIDVG